MAWTGKHRAFIVENFLPNGESVTASLRNFRNHFQLSRHDPVPDSKTLLLWVKNFRVPGSALKRKPPGRPRSVQTPENIQIVKESVLRFPRRSACKHSAALSLSVCSIRRILNSDLRSHPCKLMVAQELLERDHETRVACCKDILENVLANAILIIAVPAGGAGGQLPPKFRRFGQN